MFGHWPIYPNSQCFCFDKFSPLDCTKKIQSATHTKFIRGKSFWNFPYLDNRFHKKNSRILKFSFLLSSLTCSQILASSSCGWSSPTLLHHNKLGAKKNTKPQWMVTYNCKFWNGILWVEHIAAWGQRMEQSAIATHALTILQQNRTNHSRPFCQSILPEKPLIFILVCSWVFPPPCMGFSLPCVLHHQALYQPHHLYKKWVAPPGAYPLWRKELTVVPSPCHNVALPITLKISILRQKNNYGNSNISPCKNI